MPDVPAVLEGNSPPAALLPSLSRPRLLATESELGYQGSVALNILAAQVIKEPTPLANHHEQTTATVVIALVKAKVLG